jgi:hypothetical protein
MAIIDTQDKNLQLLISSLAIYMHKNKNTFSVTQPVEALAKLIEIYQANLVTPTEEAESLYLKDLLAAKPEDATFETLKKQIAGTLNQFWMQPYLEICEGLRNLKFSDKEIFYKLNNESSNQLIFIKNFWDPVKNFIVLVSAEMTYNQHTLDEAVKLVEQEAIQNKLQNYIRRVRAHDVYYFLSPEAKIQLYQHARVNLVMGGANGPHYIPGMRDDASLRKIAIFHTTHQEKIYLQTDYALRKMNFSAAESLALLESHADLTAITKLNETIALAPQLLTRIPVTTPVSITSVAPAPLVSNILPAISVTSSLTSKAPVSLPVAEAAAKITTPVHVRSIPMMPPMLSRMDYSVLTGAGLAAGGFLLLLACAIPSRFKNRLFGSRVQATIPLPAATRDGKHPPGVRR